MGRGTNPNAITAPRAGASWRPTDVQRRYRELLDRAKEAPQTIQDSDGELLVVEIKEQADFAHRMTRVVAEVGQFIAVFSAHGDEEPAQWAAQTPYPWLGSFDRDEAAEFARELISYTFDAAQRETLEALEGNLRAWRSTAGIYEQPEALAQLTASIDPGDIFEVFPPSDQQVREAEGEPA